MISVIESKEERFTVIVTEELMRVKMRMRGKERVAEYTRRNVLLTNPQY